jgi:hypothetical protein
MKSEFPISDKTKNLFLALAESITQALHVTSYYVCGGINMGDHWPWGARELNPLLPFDETTFPNHRESIWLLKISIIENYCISHPKGQFSTPVGDLTCLGQKFYNDTAQEAQWWGAPNHTESQPHPLANFSNLWKAWDNLTVKIDWQVPKRLYWLCENQTIWCYPGAGLGLVY